MTNTSTNKDQKADAPIPVKPAEQNSLGSLEEDDEFEEFAAEGARAQLIFRASVAILP